MSEKLKKDECSMTYHYSPTVCGTNNMGFNDLRDLMCAAKTERGKLLNLQLKHEGSCWIWETYGFETNKVIIVSKTSN